MVAMLLACGLSGIAQAPIASGLERMVAQDAAALLDHQDAEVRGEAAIVVASQGRIEHEAALLEIAADPKPAARHRGMLALGQLATPNAVHFLESHLRTNEGRSNPDGVAAAFALGCVPPANVDTSVARTLPLFERGSWKRQHEVLYALLLGMCKHPERTEQRALRVLFDNEANRSPVIRGLLLRLLLPIDDTFSDKDLRRLLQRGSANEKVAIVQWLADRTPADNQPWIPDLVKIAERAADPTLRTAALRALTRCRHLPALEIAARALQSSDPDECGQAMASMLSISGARARGALERQLLRERDPVKLMAMMGHFLAPPSKELVDYAIEIAADPKVAIGTRTAAAELISRSDKKRALPMLRNLFRRATDPQLLRKLARALRGAEESPTALSRLLQRPIALPQHPRHWQALLAAGHAGAQRQVLMTLKDPSSDAASKRSALKAWRKAMVLGPAEADALPTISGYLQ